MSKAQALNTADLQRIEAALHELIEKLPKNANPKGVAAWKRTLSKVEHLNKTGPFTPQQKKAS